MDRDHRLHELLDELDAIERQIEAHRPRQRAGRIFLALLLLALLVGVGVAVSVGRSGAVWRLLTLEIVVVAVLATSAAALLPRRTIRRLEERREELLKWVGRRPGPQEPQASGP